MHVKILITSLAAPDYRCKGMGLQILVIRSFSIILYVNVPSELSEA